MNKNVIGILKLDDVISAINVVIGDYTVDAIVDVHVVQRGTDDFEITWFSVFRNEITLCRGNEKKVVSFSNPGEYTHLVNTFVRHVDSIALPKAKESSEDLWDYKLLD